MRAEDHAILARLDERTKNIAERVQDLTTSVNKIDNDLREELKAHKDDTISRAEFDPVKRIVYGMVSCVLVLVLTAIIGLVVVQTGVAAR